jgi:hypothetical protein
MFEKPHDGFTAIRTALHAQQNLPRRRQGADDRLLITRQRDVED